MSGIDVGLIGFIAIFVLMALRVPVAVALGTVAISGIYCLMGWVPMASIVKDAPFEFAASWSLSAIPLFLLMSAVLQQSGITVALYRAARIWLAFLPGGLAVSTNVAAAGFAATSGSSMATAAAMARIAIPEMLNFGYDKRLAAGVVASAGTLGALIPPSIFMILYGVFAEVSISKMLMAGLLPGLLTLVVYVAMILIRTRLNPQLAPNSVAPAEHRERWRSLLDIWPILLLFAAMMIGIYSGLATVTEAAALGAFLSILIAVCMGRLSFAAFCTALRETLVTTAQIFLVAVGAALFTRFLVLSGLPAFLSHLFAGFAVSQALLILGMSVLFLILGMFLDPLGSLMISLPVLLPLFHARHVDLVWVGVIIVKYVEIGLLTPPVGFNAYVVKGVVGDTISLNDIFRGISWFLICEVMIMLLLIFFPQISLFIPNHLH